MDEKTRCMVVCRSERDGSICREGIRNRDELTSYADSRRMLVHAVQIKRSFCIA